MKKLLAILIILGLFTSTAFEDFPTSPSFGDTYTNPVGDIYTCDTAPIYSDSFGGSSVGANWTQIPANGTITEGSGSLTMTLSGSGDWWGSNIRGGSHMFDSTHFYSSEFCAVVKLGSYTRNNQTHAGIMLYLDDNNVYLFGNMLDGTRDGIIIEKIVGNVGTGNVWGISPPNTLPIWLRIRHSGTTYYFDYSTDGTSFTNAWSTTSLGFTPIAVGVFIKSWSGQSLSAPFTNFSIGGTTKRWDNVGKT